MTTLKYPDPADNAFRPVLRRSLWKRLKTFISMQRLRKTARGNTAPVLLDCISKGGQTLLHGGDLAAIFVVRNERALLPSFLDHYRKLGVTRFICTDDQSSDGTTEYLLEQADVDLWTSPTRYKQARRGKAWREQLFHIYGYDRWYVNVDADEYLVFAGWETTSLKTVIRQLEQCHFKRMAAPMLDMYPVDFREANPEKLAHSNPWEIASHFDPDGYRLRVKKRSLSIRGGPRRRQFGEELELMKYPIIYWDRSCQLGGSIHHPLPYDRNFVPPTGTLLHFKFFSDFETKVREAAEGGQYYNNSSAYKAVLAQLERGSSLQLASGNSVKFAGGDQLLHMGFFRRVSDFQHEVSRGNMNIIRLPQPTVSAPVSS